MSTTKISLSTAILLSLLTVWGVSPQEIGLLRNRTRQGIRPNVPIDTIQIYRRV